MPARSTATTGAASPTSLGDVKGWFPVIDQKVFTWFLERQTRLGMRGDLLELGCYLGKSAILIGRHVRDGETFTVCDLFGSDASDDDTQREVGISYATLTRDAFEANYLAFHDSLPNIVQAPTSVMAGRVPPNSCRFVHVDASHLYKNVRADIETAKSVLMTDGIVACDDFRSEHTPGVAAAVWEASFTGGLRPICLTRAKLYGTWGDTEPVQDELLEWLDESRLAYDIQTVADRRLIRIKDPAASGPAPATEAAALKARLAAVETQNEELRQRLRRIQRSRTYRFARGVSGIVATLRRR